MTPTRAFRHGLVIGKFYPPHAGHHALIRAAGAAADRVTVIAMATSAETIPLADRVAWLAAEHVVDINVTVTGIRCDAPVDYADEHIWAAQIAAMRAALAPVSAEPVDAVFTSEHYGEDLASWLDAEHVLVDPERRVGPGSATAVRADLAAHWDALAPATRAGLAVRVVVLGAESSGTTTLATALAGHYRRRGGVWLRTACVDEYGREFTVTKLANARATASNHGRPLPGVDDLVWTADDFDEIGPEQTRREDAAAATGSPLLVCDTDAFATATWERRYLPDAQRALPDWATRGLPRREVYLLTDHTGVPWDDDGLREGDLAVREAMTGWFVTALTAAGRSWVLLTGTPEQRLHLAVRITDRLLTERATFAAAVGPPAAPAVGRPAAAAERPARTVPTRRSAT